MVPMRLGVRRAALIAAAVVGVLMAPGVAEAAPWCGTAASADRPAVATGHHVRVVYLFPSEAADRSGDLAPKIWADLEEIAAWWLASDPTRAVNFDLTPFPCGHQLDLTSRRATIDSNALLPFNARFGLIRDELYQRARLDASVSKYLVYYDGPVEDPSVCGEGGAAGPGGTGLAIVYLQACPGVSTAQVGAHELIHALGALFRVAAANACPNDVGHVCDATNDILYPQAQPLPLSSFVLDFGRNDYYGHTNPWFDVQDSLWLRHLDASTELSVTVRGRGSVRSDVPGLLCSASCRTAWNPRTAVRLVAEPAQGQKFVRWSGECAVRDVGCDLLLDEPKSLTVLFAPLRYRLAVQLAGRGRVSGGGLTCAVARCTRELSSYRSVTLRATPAKGWRLKGWTGACRGAKTTCTVPMTSATSVRAIFVRRA